MSGAVAALLGAAIGAVATIGVAIVQSVARERAEARRTAEQREEAAAQERAMLMRSYLFQLDDAVESLGKRLGNWRFGGGEEHSERVDPGYFKISMLYALARALGAERILVIEGVYPQLERASPGLGEALKKQGVDAAVKDVLRQRLLHYHRSALAEAALQREPEGWRVLTYTEFTKRCADPAWALENLLDLTYTALGSLKPAGGKGDQLQTALTSLRTRLASFAA